MRRVTGIGGVFFKSRDPQVLREWYRKHLGIDVQSWGGASFTSRPDAEETTVWSVSPETSDYFAPSKASFMINYRVENLRALIATLREEGCTVDEKIDEGEFGTFGWVMDPEGNRIELWQPPAAVVPG
jgi:predicted enzyme related to lactoylglutathione lyase